MSEDRKISDHLWEYGWDGHEKAQLIRMSKLCLIEKIRWLEEAQEMLENLNKSKNKTISVDRK